jgi:hypothetical protein
MNEPILHRQPSDDVDATDPYANLDRPDSPWNVAAATRAEADPFCCRSEWQLSFHEAFTPPFHPPRTLRLRSCDGAVMALAERDDPRIGPLLEPVEAHWMFGTPLLGEGAVALLDDFLRERDVLPSVLISALQPDDPRRAELMLTFRDRFDFYRTPPETLCRASLDGGLDGYLSRRASKLRRDLRRQARKAEARGVTFERHTPRDDDEAAAVYARLLAIEERSWKGVGKCGMAEQPSRRFYGIILRRGAAGGIGRVMIARDADGDDIGFIFGNVAGTTYRGQQFSFIESWRDASLGNLLQLEQLRWLCEEGVQRYDMGPFMDYKRRWTETAVPIENWVLRPGARRPG